MSVWVIAFVGYLVGLFASLGLVEVEHELHRTVSGWYVPLPLNVAQTLLCCFSGAWVAVWIAR